jgi:hypothetical protein
MTFSIAGLIGAAAGFAIATALYLAAIKTFRRETPDSGESAEARGQTLAQLRTLMLMDIPILTVIGYYCGRALQ